jgi:4-amino-4-deoxy-L-arabinose transferase-like glycosyltransferase
MLSSSTVRKLLIAYVLLLVPISWLATKYQPYQMDGDSMAYMDIADLIRSHTWAGIVNGYWHPLYPLCLAIAQTIFHPTRWTELGAYYGINEAIFLVSVVAMLAFVSALVKLRTRMLPSADQDPGDAPLLGLNAMRLLGLGLLTIAAQRELSTAYVKPDALLQAMMLAAFAMLLQALASESFVYPPLVGLFFGLAYLTKSFAFLVALLSIAVMLLFQWWFQGRSLRRVAVGGALAVVVFAAVAGPYVAALSKQKGRFDFGDSGALNYAWYVSGTAKMHIEPSMTKDFGSASVNLVHPEKQLLQTPGVYSYKAEPYGTYPEWFDTTYFKERIVPKFNAARLFKRDIRNVALVFRYLFNHPEAWTLLALLLVCGARPRVALWRQQGFWIPMALLGMAMWGIYGLVNVEERYVTLAYLVIVIPVFSMLTVPNYGLVATTRGVPPEEFAFAKVCQRPIAAALVALLAYLSLGETLRVAFDDRRNASGHLQQPWYSPEIYGAAKGLAAMGVRPGDEIACIGTTACLHDPYWQRIAGVRMLTEVYNPDDTDLIQQLQGLPNRQQVYDIVRAEGAKVLVASFDPGEMNASEPASAGWERLGTTNFYALPLNLPARPSGAPVTKPWTPMIEVAP